MSDIESETKYETFSKKRMLGFSLGGGVILAMMWAIRSMIQVYAEKALKLSILTVFIILTIYAIWDAVNDPLTGYLLDRSKKFTSKYGKRFPFIAIGFIGSLCTLTLLFLPITTDPILAVIWILLFLIVWDQFQTLAELSLTGLSVDIFRDKDQRARYGAYNGGLDTIQSLLRAVTIPIVLGMFGGLTQPTAYFFMAVVLCLFLTVLLIFHLIAVREPEEMIEFRARLDQEGKSFSSSFLEVLGRSLRDKNWMGFIIAYLAFSVYVTSITIGIYYFAVDGLGLPVEAVALFGVGYLAAGFCTVPIWMKLTKKLGGRKTYFYAMLYVVILAPLFLIFAWELIPALIVASLVGAGASGMLVAVNTVYSEAIDNATAQTGTREEASYLGVFRFFTGLVLVGQVLIFLVVASITGYNPAIGATTEAQRIGLNVQMSVFPGVILLIAGLIFLKFNKITKEVALENKKILLEMGL